MKKTILLFILVASLASCKKGDTGTPGTNGTNGNANVQTTIFTNESFYYNTGGDYTLDVTVPAITQDVIDKGSVSVYWRLGSGYNWNMLPSTREGVDVDYSLQKVVLWAKTMLPPHDVKVVVIPAN